MKNTGQALNIAGWLLSFALSLGAHAQTVYYHNDMAGSPLAASDEGGSLLWREGYRPYGERIQVPASDNKLWFHGKQADDDSGLSNFGARSYDPIVGRFMGTDPQAFNDQNIHSFNRYAYGNNNPYKFKDPDGRHPILLLLFRIAYSARSLAVVEVAAGATGATTSAIGVAGKAGKAADAISDTAAGVARGLPDSVLVCRGGACKAENFLQGSGVKQAADGTLSGVSTQSRAGASVDELAKPFYNNQVGVTTAGEVRAAGGRVTADGHAGNPNHATVDGLTPHQLEGLFTPTIPNPVPPGQRGF
jgi:RHS repeat-associated protein